MPQLLGAANVVLNVGNAKRLKIKEKFDQWISATMIVASRHHVAEKVTP